MRKRSALLLIGLGATAGLIATTRLNAERAPELRTVDRVDLSRYVGRWYEVARYPNRFERDCDRDVTAEYAQEDGKIQVVNSCTKKNGERKVAKGKAKVAEKQTNAKLRVTFFWPFYGAYWIIDLDPEYRWAVIGEPSRKYLWILSRTPKLDDRTYSEITSRLASRGYDAAKLLRVKQTAAE